MLPQITLRELAAQDCRLLTLPDFACCYDPYRAYLEEFPALAEVIYETHFLSKEKSTALATRPPVLSITHCLALLELYDIIHWEAAQFSAMGKDSFRSCSWIPLRDSLKKELDHDEVIFVGELEASRTV